MAFPIPNVHLGGWDYGHGVPYTRFELNQDHPLAKGIVFWLPAKPQLGVNAPNDMSLYHWPLEVHNNGPVGFILDGEKGWVREFDDAGVDGLINHYAYQFDGFKSTIIVDMKLNDLSASHAAIGMMDSIGSGGMYLLYRLSDTSVVARLWQNTGETSTAGEIDSNVAAGEWRQWCGCWRSPTWRALFVDADQQESIATLRETPPDTWNIHVGSAYYDSGDGWGLDGYIGDGVVWNRGLTDEEIAWYYNDPFVLYKPVSPPRYYSFPAAEAAIITGIAALSGAGALDSFGSDLNFPFSDVFTGSDDDPWDKDNWKTFKNS